MTEPLDRCPRDSKLFQFTTRQLMRIAFLVLAVSFLLACTESNRLGEVQEAGADLPYFSEGATGAVEVDDPTITLAKIKDKIAFIEAEISRGDGSAEYESCVHSKYLPLREDTSGSSRGSIHHQKHLFRDD